MQRTRNRLGGMLVAAFALSAASGVWGKSTELKKAEPASTSKAKPASKPGPGPAAKATAPAGPSAEATAPPKADPALPAEPAGEPGAPDQSAGAPFNGNPYLAYRYQTPTVESGRPADGVVSNPFGMGLPGLPLDGQAILPRITTVYPTGEKPLVVLTFKCPTELIGITPLPTKALHDLVTLAMDGLNRSNLLAFNLQQVCQ